MSTDPIYNTIGKTYDTTRKPDPEITQQLIDLLCPIKNGRYLDVGCGSGNYTGALAQRGLNIEGIDISVEMLSKAKVKHPALIFHHANAEQMPFEDKTFDGAICTLATHHIKDKAKVFKEISRVLKRKSQLVIFTVTPEQVQHYWLDHYFPTLIKDAMHQMTSFEDLKSILDQAGFEDTQQTPFFITNDLQDWFLYAGKYRPEIYLDPIVRENISCFHLSIDQTELGQGLKKLKVDIDSGEINNIIRQYENNIGEHIFVSCKKLKDK